MSIWPAVHQAPVSETASLHLRSTDSSFTLADHRPGGRAFADAGPSTWNSQCLDVHETLHTARLFLDVHSKLFSSKSTSVTYRAFIRNYEDNALYKLKFFNGYHKYERFTLGRDTSSVVHYGPSVSKYGCAYYYVPTCGRVEQ